MNDKTIKGLLLLIAVGLLLNAAALFYQALVPNAFASDGRMYIEGGRLEVTLNSPVSLRVDRNLPVQVEGEMKISSFGNFSSDSLPVRVINEVQVTNR